MLNASPVASVREVDARYWNSSSVVKEKPKLLDRLRQTLRSRHYSRRTEQTYCQWVKRFVHYHNLRHSWDMRELNLSDIMAERYYTYILQSEKDKNFYVGLTNDIRRQITEHHEGKVQSTKTRRPLKLVYWEGCLNQPDAARREKYLKSAWGKRYLKNRLKNYLTG